MSWYFDAFLPFSMLQTPLYLQIFMFSSFLDPALELPKPDYSKPETGISGFYSLAKFGHQQLVVLWSSLLCGVSGPVVDRCRDLSKIMIWWGRLLTSRFVDGSCLNQLRTGS
jgi:hypothetical protein